METALLNRTAVSSVSLWRVSGYREVWGKLLRKLTQFCVASDRLQGVSLKSAVFGTKVVSSQKVSLPAKSRSLPVTAASGDRWGGLGKDMSDDQQDIARGYGLVDSAFQVIFVYLQMYDIRMPSMRMQGLVARVN